VSARGADFVQSFERGLSVIRAFGGDRRRRSLREIAEETGLTTAATRRFLLTLVELGLVTRDGREFLLGPRVLDLGYATLSGLSVAELVRPYVEDLVAEVDESGAVSVLVGGEIVSLVRVPTRRMMTVALAPGSRLPAHCTSAGRVLLAGLDPASLDAFLEEVPLQACTARTITDPSMWRRELDRVRREGFAVVDQEYEEGLIALAVPIRDSSDNVVAALNVSVDAFRAGPGELEQRLLEPLRAVAARIEPVVWAVGPAGGLLRDLPGAR
jgi:IclR family pca regulon transcriptional regulator